MKIIETISLIRRGKFADSKEWEDIRTTICSAISQAEWPKGTGKFVIFPESGKKSGQGNGVVPIKEKPMHILKESGWQLEYPWDVAQAHKTQDTQTSGRRAKGARPGKIDAAKQYPQGLVVVEWETGNISSSHRAINKMALGLITGKCVAGTLVVPNTALAKYLTDRVGNVEELRPYFPFWQAINLQNGILEIVVIEHDGEDVSSPKIPKGTDGRAKQGAAKKKKSGRGISPKQS